MSGLKPFPHFVSRASCILVLLLSTSLASAQSCDELSRSEIELNGAKARLLADYPGTAATMFACAMFSSGQPESDKATSMLACAGLACAFIGIGTCYNMAVQVMQLQEREEWISQRKREKGC